MLHIYYVVDVVDDNTRTKNKQQVQEEKNEMMIKNIVLEGWLFGTPTIKEASII